MSVYAIVPVQYLDLAKSRLAPSLSSEARRALVLRSLTTVLDALSGSALVDVTLVVTPDSEVSEHATLAGAIALAQPGRGLNEAIRQGRDHAAEHGADAILIVLADLPLLSTTDIDNLLEASGDAAVTLAPDRHGSGTNVLVLRPLDAIEPAFGVDSYRIHRSEADRQQRSSRTFHARGTAYDVDTADDLFAIEQLLAGIVRSTAEPRALISDRVD